MPLYKEKEDLDARESSMALIQRKMLLLK